MPLRKCLSKYYWYQSKPWFQKNDGIHPNVNHRVVLDDVGHGLCVLYSIRNCLPPEKQPQMRMTKMLIEFFQDLMNKSFLVDGELTGVDCKGLVLAKNLDSVAR